ncbi:MAG TPA: outer membrane beta-barrel protein [Candidatus Acidoferrum sp.]|nr:outer membrane beta-barrel protein [Candidatus Acidoferrum sp.]
MKQLPRIVVYGAMLLGAVVAAPRAMAQGPLVSGTGPEVEMHGGFEYIGQQVPSTSRVTMYGVDSGLTVGVSRHFGVRLDLGYARAGSLFESGHSSDILSYMAGPVIYPARTQRLSPYVELLVGGARVTGATPDVQGGYVRGYVNQLAWAGGAGVEIRTTPAFALRVGADYMHTSYFDPTLAVAGQGNIRGLVSFTYYLGGRRR